MHRFWQIGIWAIVGGILMGAAIQRTPSSSAAVETVSAETTLAKHGIGLTAPELIKFLEDGFSGGINKDRLPVKPVEKTQLAIDAMARLAKLRSTESVPLLVRIAVMEMPAGIQQLLSFDLENTSPEGRNEFRQKSLRLLRYNAVNALGLVGDAHALNAVRNAFNAEQSPAARIQYALALASLGDSSGVDYLVEVIQVENRRESAAAAKAFYMITEQDFGYTENTAIKARRAKARMYRDWWKKNRTSFRPEPEAIYARRVKGDPLPSFEPRSTRDLLKLATNYLDFDNKMRSRDARDRLAQSGTSLNGDLQKIAMDEMEDLDIRMEAMNWYYQANRSASEDFLKRLRRDENPEIIDKAQSLLEQIEYEANLTRGVTQK